MGRGSREGEGEMGKWGGRRGEEASLVDHLLRCDASETPAPPSQGRRWPPSPLALSLSLARWPERTPARRPRDNGPFSLAPSPPLPLLPSLAPPLPTPPRPPAPPAETPVCLHSVGKITLGGTRWMEWACPEGVRGVRGVGDWCCQLGPSVLTPARQVVVSASARQLELALCMNQLSVASSSLERGNSRQSWLAVVVVVSAAFVAAVIVVEREALSHLVDSALP